MLALCMMVSTPDQAGSEETPPAAPDEQPAIQALLDGKEEEALELLFAAVTAGAYPADPSRVVGRFVGLVPFPDGDAPSESTLRAALAQLRAGNYTAASPLLLRAMAEAPHRPEPFLYAGLAYLAQDKNEAARGALIKATDNDPRCWPCRLGLSIALERLTNLSEAEAHLQKADGLAPGHPVVAYYLARREIRRGDRAAARSYFARTHVLAYVGSSEPALGEEEIIPREEGSFGESAGIVSFKFTPEAAQTLVSKIHHHKKDAAENPVRPASIDHPTGVAPLDKAGEEFLLPDELDSASPHRHYEVTFSFRPEEFSQWRFVSARVTPGREREALLAYQRLVGIVQLVELDFRQIYAPQKKRQPLQVTESPSVPLPELLSAPEAVEIDGRRYTLKPYLWRDFQPISPPDGKPLLASVRVMAEDLKEFPASLSMDKLWVIRDRREAWEADFSKESRPQNPAWKHVLERIARGGPKWGPRITVEVVVRLRRGEKETFFLRAGRQWIDRTD